MKSINVLIAESFDIYRLGIEKALQKSKQKIELTSFASGCDLLDRYSDQPNSVCLISSNISDMNIHELMEGLKKANPEPGVIVLTHSTDFSHLNQSLKAGVRGYVGKNITCDELIDVVLEVSAGKKAFSKAASQLMAGRYADIAKKSTTAPKKRITKREREILKLIVEGYTSAEIAKTLYISTRTVETHRSNLMSKLNLKNTAALVRFAMEENLS
ncbi:MAG: response regulator [Bacteroidetes bacterium]|jgi:DNA-binding NarL/FixJ family response regulator|nr:response regulator [Bacteroidota bacterium]